MEVDFIAGQSVFHKHLPFTLIPKYDIFLHQIFHTIYRMFPYTLYLSSLVLMNHMKSSKSHLANIQIFTYLTFA